ncbi:MAG: hypothetical protein JW741_22110, partial [Sedimentisphaerales bacterium]|nr:hypothetical protein [Sedimentisphaerales bacterium]
YNSCKTVVLTRKAEGLYQGFAEFANGRRSGLVVTIADGNIEYAFVAPAPPGEGESVEPGDAEALRATLDEVEVLARWQEAEIARLQALCREAGLDPNPPETEAGAEPNYGDVASAADVPIDAGEARGEGPQASPGQGLDFTSEMYGRIRKDMPRSEIVDLLGAAGDRLSSSYFEGAANEVYAWTNADDSHICVVFRDDKVLVKTQFGLPGIAPVPEQGGRSRTIDVDQFRNWQLAQNRGGRTVALGLSLGQWLEDVYRVLERKTPNAPAQIGIVEEQDQIVVTVTRDRDGNGEHRISLHLRYLSLDADDPELAELMDAEKVLVPARMSVNDRVSENPVQIWRAMAALAEFPIDTPDNP